MFANLIRGSVAALVVVTGLVSSAFGAGFDVNATITNPRHCVLGLNKEPSRSSTTTGH